MPDYYSHELPTATEVPTSNSESIPFATQIWDTKKLYRRWAKCCEITLHIAHIGFSQADNLQTQATVMGTFGLLFSSRSMQESASAANKQAHETRMATIYFAAAFLVASVVITSLYWAVEEGLIGTIVKSVVAAFKWVGSGIASLFRRAPSDISAPVASPTMPQTMDPVQEAIPVVMEREPTKAMLHSYGPFPEPSAPPLPGQDYYNQQSESAHKLQFNQW